MSATVTYPPVILDGWLPSSALSPNARGHWAKRAKAAREARTTVWGAVLHAQWRPVRRGMERDWFARYRLTITMTRKRLLDDDNAYAICKSLVDGVVDTGIVADDSPRYLSIVVKQEKGEPSTRLELEEVTDGDC